MPDVTIRRAVSAADLEAAFAVRRQVFVLEQGVPEDMEIDEFDRDPQTIHVLVHDARHAALGTARLRPCRFGGAAKIQRVAVLATHRKTGLGRALMEFLERAAAEGECGEAVLDAQLQAQAFYERLGYEVYGERFVEAGIDHIAMRKRLGAVPTTRQTP